MSKTTELWKAFDRACTDFDGVEEVNRGWCTRKAWARALERFKWLESESLIQIERVIDGPNPQCIETLEDGIRKVRRI